MSVFFAPKREGEDEFCANMRFLTQKMRKICGAKSLFSRGESLGKSLRMQNEFVKKEFQRFGKQSKIAEKRIKLREKA